MNRALLCRAARYTAGLLLSWQSLPSALRRCRVPLCDLLRELSVVLLVLVMPLLFWLAPLLAWHALRGERRCAASGAGQ